MYKILSQLIEHYIYLKCKSYIDVYNGQNNSDLKTNGELYFLEINLNSMKTVFDIGAHTGKWSKQALKINNKIQLHVFEPSKSTYKMLKKNNFSNNVICKNFGFSSSEGEKILYTYKNYSKLNSLYKRYGLSFLETNMLKKEKIIVKTIDGYCKKMNINNVDFVKIDVEGHEVEVIRGAKKMLKRGSINIIQFEYGGTYISARCFLKDIFDILENLPYKIYKLFPRKLKLIEKYDQSLENFQYSNYLIIKIGYKFNSNII